MNIFLDTARCSAHKLEDLRFRTHVGEAGAEIPRSLGFLLSLQDRSAGYGQSA